MSQFPIVFKDVPCSTIDIKEIYIACQHKFEEYKESHGYTNNEYIDLQAENGYLQSELNKLIKDQHALLKKHLELQLIETQLIGKHNNLQDKFISYLKQERTQLVINRNEIIKNRAELNK